MLYDLSARVQALKQDSIMDRMAEAVAALPEVGVVGLNGVPFIGNPVTYFGVPVTHETICQQMRLGLGFGAVLPGLNQRKYELDRLCQANIENYRYWALRDISATLCFAGCPPFFELAFARDRRFHLSGIEPTGTFNWNHPRIFTASGSLWDWKKYTLHRMSLDLPEVQRVWLTKAHTVLAPLFPEFLE